MNIGKAAAASGVSAKMIRYYEQVGLVMAPARTDAGYRSYGARDVHILRFIHRARDLGFTVDEIRDLLSLWQDQNRQSADVKRIAIDQIAVLERKAHDLQQMADTLRTLADGCSGDSRPDCPIIAELETGEGRTTRPPRRRFGVAGELDTKQGRGK